MSDGAISQSELDALLNSASGGVDFGGGSGGGLSSSSDLDFSFLKDFASKNADTLGSIIGSMVNDTVTVSAPSMKSVNRDGAIQNFPDVVVAITSDFSGGLFGDHIFLMDPDFAKKIVSVVNGEEDPEIDDMAISVISEIASQITGSEITTLNGTGKLPGLACNPAAGQSCHKAMVRFPQRNFAMFTYKVTYAGADYSFYEIMSEEVAKGIITAYGGGSSNDTFKLDAGMGTGGTGMNMGGMNMGGMNMGGMNMGGMNMGGMNMGGMNMGGMNMGGVPGMYGGMPNVQNVTYPSLGGGVVNSEQGNIGLIMDVKMEMTVELGRTKRLIKDILGMGEGTIIELEKQAGEPVDILVNNKPIAKGEVVVIDENFGVRVTEILSPSERLPDTQ
ncbi:MAG: flagellar motor switch protein FliN [Treponemataceae bacterium]|nr:flagellar motor switch protein FliN [Treponemataceae bacterium]